jgi:hypothetical protein
MRAIFMRPHSHLKRSGSLLYESSDLFVVTRNKLLGDCSEPLVLLYFLLNCPAIRKHSPPASKRALWPYGPFHPTVAGDGRARVTIIFTAFTLCYEMNDPGVKQPLSISVHLSNSNSIIPRPNVLTGDVLRYIILPSQHNGPDHAISSAPF